MGYTRHHAILVSSPFSDTYDAHKKALAVFGGHGAVSPVHAAEMNNVSSFAVFPDGSKEGWLDSDQGDERRRSFIDYLKSTACADGSYLDWVEVSYGDDHGPPRVVSFSDEEEGSPR